MCPAFGGGLVLTRGICSSAAVYGPGLWARVLAGLFRSLALEWPVDCFGRCILDSGPFRFIA